MARKKFSTKLAVASPNAVLLIGPPGASRERKKIRLEASGFDVIVAENICSAEACSETRRFDAAIFDEALPPHEQTSLASVMRIRWPWMRLVACGPTPRTELFDANEPSELELPAVVRATLLKRGGSHPD